MRRAAVIVTALALACIQAPIGDPGDSGKADDLGPLPNQVPKRVIWLIGDGMGVNQLSAAAYAKGEPLAMLSAPEMAFIATHEHEYATTDSAASATAMASGTKTHFEGIGILPGTTADNEEDPGQHLDTVIDVAQSAGWRTGLVATTSVVDATPAAFAAHRAKRKSKSDIARDLAESGVDVLLGGGLSYFEGRSDGLDLIQDFRDKGYSIAKTKTGLSMHANAGKQKVVGLFADKDMPEVGTGNRKVSLEQMTERAIQILDSQNDDGFFLMVEGSWIDRESHVVNGVGTVDEALDFDAAVTVALDYARGRDDTLVIITADHETGGLAILDGVLAQARIDALGGEDAAIDLAAFPSFGAADPFQRIPRGAGVLTPPASAGQELVTSYGHMSVASRPTFTGPTFLFRAAHTNTNVVLFAEGPGAAFVTGVRDNADLGSRVHRLVAADGEADSGTDDSDDDEPESLVLVVADGLGLSSLTAAQYAGGDTRISRMPNLGLTTTHASDALVGEAAGSAATLSTGQLAASSGQDVDAALALLARAEAAGKRTAIVTDADITDPVLAAFIAPGVDDAGAALVDLEAGDGVDLVFAGGAGSLSAAEKGRWADRGVEVQDDWSSSAPSGAERVARLIADGALPPAADRGSLPSLAEMTGQAVEALESSGEPYVLVVYAAGVGRQATELERGSDLIAEIVAVDESVAGVLNAVANQPVALVVTSLGDSTLSVLDNHYGFHKNLTRTTAESPCAAAVRSSTSTSRSPSATSTAPTVSRTRSCRVTSPAPASSCSTPGCRRRPPPLLAPRIPARRRSSRSSPRVPAPAPCAASALRPSWPPSSARGSNSLRWHLPALVNVPESDLQLAGIVRAEPLGHQRLAQSRIPHLCRQNQPGHDHGPNHDYAKKQPPHYLNMSTNTPRASRKVCGQPGCSFIGPTNHHDI
jgi:alkaline phosphatase